LRIYEGSPRQDFEEVFRAIGAVLDERGYREILLTEVPDGFLVQGLRATGVTATNWSDAIGHLSKETLTFSDEEIARYMDEALARRGKTRGSSPNPATNYYEQALRVIGRYLDEQRPRDVFFLEQEGSFVVRMLSNEQAGSRHRLAEFTRDDLTEMIGQATTQRGKPGVRNALLGS
jgi:hypothetical protein